MDFLSDSVVGVVGKVIDKIWPDPAQRDAAKLALFQAQQAGQLAELDADLKQALGQLEVDKTEAGNANIFVSGWRPFVGWGCGVGVIYDCLVHPFVGDIASIAGRTITLPTIDTVLLTTILLGMLGLGAQHTIERIKGVAQGQSDKEMPSYQPVVKDKK